MPIEEINISVFENINFIFFAKPFLILFAIFYVVFAFMLLRQVQLMCRTLPTSLSPLLKFLAIIHVGIALAVLLVVLGFF